jgi:hypothetical protein
MQGQYGYVTDMSCTCMHAHTHAYTHACTNLTDTRANVILSLQGQYGYVTGSACTHARTHA